MTEPNRYAVPLELLDGPSGEHVVAEVGDAREVPDWSAAPGQDAAADGDGE